MTALLDVPTSGIYLQQGAVTDLVVQILDINTGLPVQLQTATGLAIYIQYPDLSYAALGASLYTDGSDGCISFITVNTPPTNVTLSQIGLYHVQGQATIGGATLPRSMCTDFYVLPNADTQTVPPEPPTELTPTAFILFDTNGVRWATTATTAGALDTFAAQTSIPVNSLLLNSLVMKDSDGIYWTVTVTTAGVLSTTPGGSFASAVDRILLMDSNGTTWVVTISTLGVLVAS